MIGNGVVSTSGGDLLVFKTNASIADPKMLTVAIDSKKGRACEAFSNNAIACRIPTGTGYGYNIQLVSSDTNEVLFLDGCVFNYGAPSITSIRGCEQGCQRGGGAELEILGVNFGSSKALVFANGVQCDGRNQSHNSLTCALRSSTVISTDQDSVVIIVNGQEDVYSEGTPLYSTCSTNEFQDRNDAGVYVCTSCAFGSYSSSGTYCSGAAFEHSHSDCSSHSLEYRNFNNMHSVSFFFHFVETLRRTRDRNHHRVRPLSSRRNCGVLSRQKI